MAGRHKGPLRIAIEDWLQTFDLGAILGRWFKGAGESHEQEIVRVNQELLDMMKDLPGLPKVLRDLADMEDGDNLQGGILTAGGFASEVGRAAAGGILGPVVNMSNYLMDSIVRSARPNLDTMILMRRFEIISEEDYRTMAGELGWSKELVQAYEEATQFRFGPGDLLNLYRRREISDVEFIQELQDRGWQTKEINQFLKLTQLIPGVGELITMTVREAFNDEVASRFGYDEDFPSEVLPYTSAQGLSEEWVRRYWRMHWVLPSVGQGFEMLHRLRPGTTDVPFTDQDLEILLKALDIPNYWRSRLTQVSYNPLTRVDVRRMHDMGILDREDVKGSYLDIGYNEENAENMTQFTEAYNAQDKKSLSRSAVLKAYKKGILNENEALDIMTASGHSVEEAQFYVDLTTFEILEEQTDLETDLVHDRYLAGEIDKVAVHRELVALQLPTEQVERLLTRWELELSKKQRLPTESELENFYKLGYIEEADYRQGLRDRQYKPESIDWYIRQADQDIAEKTAAQERDALEVQEKLRNEALASEYRIARQELDVMIAQERANIAELKLLTHSIEDKEMIGQIKERMDALKLRIRQLQVAEADLELSEDIETREV